MGPRRFLAALATTLLLFPVPDLAAQPQAVVRCDAMVGFNGTAREGRFAPVILSIENPGARITAEVVLRVTWGGSFRGSPAGRTVRQETILDAGTTRRIPFLVPIPRSALSLKATVSSQGVDVGGLEVELRPMTTTARIVAGVSSDLSLDGLSALPGSSGTLRVVYPRVDDLPQVWAGWDGVDAVIVHDTSFQQLRSDQVTALERWVLTGGILVFTGGAAALQHEPAGFGRLLPVEIAGLAQRTGLELPLPGASTRQLPGRVDLADSRLKEGRVLAADGSLPVVVRRSLGRGSIWFLAFDPTVPPVSSWDGLLSMWRYILAGDRMPAMGAAPRETLSDPWITALLAASPVSFPPVPAVLAFIACYLALLVPLGIARPAGAPGGAPAGRITPRVRLLLFVAASTSATLSGWVLFNSLLFHPGLQVLDAARVEARSGDGLALVMEKVGYFSSSARHVEVRLGSGDTVIEAAGVPTGPGDLTTADLPLDLFGSGNRTVIRGLDVERLGTRLLVLQQIVPLDIRVNAEVHGSTLAARVTNGDRRMLKGCFIMRAGRAYPLGDVGAGTTIRREFDLAQGVLPLEHGAWFLGGDARQAVLWKAEAEETIRTDSPWTDSPAQLVAWLEGPVLPLSVPDGELLGGRPGLALLRVEAE
jgi:hypothetical protein